MSDLRTAIFPSLSVVLSLCDVPKTVLTKRWGTSSRAPGPLGATALIVTPKKANKKNADEYFSFYFYFF